MLLLGRGAPKVERGAGVQALGSDQVNFADCVEAHARRRGDHPAIEDGSRVLTYGELNTRVNDAVRCLLDAKVRPGEIVVVMLPDSLEHLVVLLALARAGVVALSIEETLPEAEKARAIAGLSIGHLICGASAASFAGLRRVAVEDICRDGTTVSAEGRATQAPAMGGDRPMYCTQSSGTTRRPKSFFFSHSQTEDWIDRYNRNGGTVVSDRYLSMIRMSFSYGRNLCFAALRAGATVVVDPSETSEDSVRAIRQRRVTVLSVTPSHLQNFLEVEGAGPLFPNLRALFVATAASSQQLKRLARQRLTDNLIECYGSNEMGHVLFAGPAEQDAHPGTLGRVIEGIEGQVVDDDDRPLPVGQTGHLRFRGSILSDGYIDDPDASRLAFRHPWFYPGDLAVMNEDGYLFLQGRANDVINNQGAKISPGEVEAVLLEHPAIEEVAVFGWPHERLGEEPVAAIRTSAPVQVEDLIRHCRARLSGPKVPRRYMLVSEVPRNPMGKILRRTLRALYERKSKPAPNVDSTEN